MWPVPAPAVGAADIQDGRPLTDHAHPDAVVTSMPTVPPASPTAVASDVTLKTHGTAAAPACDTLKVWPAIVTLPLRAPPVFGAIATFTVPLPAPLAGRAVIHGAPVT